MTRVLEAVPFSRGSADAACARRRGLRVARPSSRAISRIDAFSRTRSARWIRSVSFG